MTGRLGLVDGSEPLPALRFVSDTNTGLRRSAADVMRAVTGGVDAMMWDDAQKTWVLGALDVAGAFTAAGGSTFTGGSLISQLLASGIQFVGQKFTNDSNPAVLLLQKSRGATLGADVIVQDGDTLAQLAFDGSDGTQQRRAADILAVVDGTPGAGDMPGTLVLRTTPDGSVVAVERLAIRADGTVQIPNRSSPLIQFSGSGFVDLTEIGAPANPAADVARLYALDVGGLTRLAYRDSAGTQQVLTQTDLDRQVFTSSGTWSKPVSGTVAYIQCWGGGGGGGDGSSNDSGSGGGGGAYAEKWIPLASLSSSESVTVGSGGSPGNPAGNGGNSSFGSHLAAFGGGGGTSSAGSNQGGGGGGLDTNGTDGDSGGIAGYDGGDGASAGAAGNPGRYGGGGGGGGRDGSVGTGGDGGSSIWGGGGGAGAGTSSAGSPWVGGISYFGGGNGGDATFDSGNGEDGTIPGGGGGGAENGTAGTGARGEVVVTVF